MEERWRGPGKGRILADHSQLCRQVAECEVGIGGTGDKKQRVSFLKSGEFCLDPRFMFGKKRPMDC